MNNADKFFVIFAALCSAVWFIYWVAKAMRIKEKKAGKEAFSDAVMAIFITPVAILPVIFILILGIPYFVFEVLPNWLYDDKNT